MKPTFGILRSLPLLLVLFVWGSVPIRSIVAQEIDAVATSLNPHRGRPIYTFALHNLSFSPYGTTISAGNGQGKVWLFDLESDESRSFQAHENWTFSAIFDRQSDTLITAGGDDLVRVWQVGEEITEVTKFVGHEGDVHAVVTYGDDKLVSAGDDQTIMVWNREDGTLAKTITGHEKQIPTIAISPRGPLLASGSRDQTVRLWDLESGEELYVMRGHTGDVMRVVFSNSGHWIASGSYDKTVRIWSTDMGSEMRTLQGHEGSIVSIAISADDRWIASVDHMELRLNPAPGNDAEMLSKKLVGGEDEQLSFVAFDPLQPRLAVSTTLGRLLILDQQTLEVLKEFETQEPSAEE